MIKKSFRIKYKGEPLVDVHENGMIELYDLDNTELVNLIEVKNND